MFRKVRLMTGGAVTVIAPARYLRTETQGTALRLYLTDGRYFTGRLHAVGAAVNAFTLEPAEVCELRIAGSPLVVPFLLSCIAGFSYTPAAYAQNVPGQGRYESL